MIRRLLIAAIRLLGPREPAPELDAEERALFPRYLHLRSGFDRACFCDMPVSDAWRDGHRVTFSVQHFEIDAAPCPKCKRVLRPVMHA